MKLPIVVLIAGGLVLCGTAPAHAPEGAPHDDTSGLSSHTTHRHHAGFRGSLCDCTLRSSKTYDAKDDGRMAEILHATFPKAVWITQVGVTPCRRRSHRENP